MNCRCEDIIEADRRVDFIVGLTFENKDGEIDALTFPLKYVFIDTFGKKYVVESDGSGKAEGLKNCFIKDNLLYAAFVNHHFFVGYLKAELWIKSIFIPDVGEGLPDDELILVSTSRTNIKITGRGNNSNAFCCDSTNNCITGNYNRVIADIVITGNTPTPKPGQITVKWISQEPLSNGEIVFLTQYYDKGDSVTEYPLLPVVDSRLEFDSWTHNLEDLQSLQHDINVGLRWQPKDEKSRAFIEITPASGKEVTVCISVGNAANIEVDWGDGKVDYTTSTGSLTHIYDDYGKKEISIINLSGYGYYALGGGTTSFSFIGESNQYVRDTLIKVWVSKKAYSSPVAAGGFYVSRSLKYIIIPVLSSTIQSSFYSCISLSYIILPDQIQSIGNNSFGSCYGLTDVDIPKTIESLTGGSNFSSCFRILSYTFQSEIPPTITTTAFLNINSRAKIYVPDSSVIAYKEATNWQIYADYIYPISQKIATLE